MDDPIPEPTPTEAVEPRRALQVWADITAVLLVLMETSWVNAYFRAFAGPLYQPPALTAYLTLAGVMLAVYFAVTLMERLRLLPRLIQGALLVLAVLSLAVAGNLLIDAGENSLLRTLLALEGGTFLLILGLTWVWWRAITLARFPVDPKAAWKRFWLGLWMLLVYFAFVAPLMGAPAAPGVFVLFLITGLLALVSARIAFISLYHGSARNPFTRAWLGVIALSVGGLVGITALIATLLTGQFSNLLELLTTFVRYVAVAVVFLFSIPWLLLSYLLEPLLPFLRDMFQQAALEATTTPFPTAAGQVEQAYPVAYPPANVFAFAPYCVSIIFWLAVVLALILIINSSRKRLRPYPSALGQSESLFSDEETLLDALRKAARDRFQEAADALGRLRPGRRQLAARVRQLYAELLDLARELDAPRPEGKTPLEFLPVLEDEFAGLGAELNVLTQAYVRVRYGELPESAEEVRQVEAAWERLHRAGEQRKKELKALAQEALKRQKKKP